MDHSNIRNIVDLDAYPLEDDIFTESCKTKINENGVLTLPNFLNESIIKKYNTQHRNTLIAIRAREPENAAKMMREHLQTARLSLTIAADA